MRIVTLLAIAAWMPGGCSPQDTAQGNRGAGDNAAAPADAPASARGLAWDLQSSGEGVALALLSADRAAAIRLFCPAGQSQLLVNVPTFRPIGSEERLSFGSGSEAIALVADTRGDAQRGGVSGTGQVPDNLAAIVSGPISASYGAQSSGPHAAPPANLARAFAAACSDDAPGTDPGQPGQPEPGQPTPQPASACRTQEGKPVPPNRIRAVGTEPFWGARIDGRCVTYSHPDDQDGTRVWTQFAGTASSGTWRGALGGAPFVLRTRPQPGCSDGMSDNRYPIAVTLTVGGEQRTGCALPL
ncbi:MAG TPA: hypothetical protein VMN38_00970 [Sphingomicrobium sp.]|nr:hypothetical protein [Sphingomicrobium sp.]